MAVIVYLDEAGDHSLEREDRDFPVFALVMFVCDTDHYAQVVVPAVYKLKMDYFGHEGAILHSRDIRKAQGAFSFLRDEQQRQPFYERINEIMRESEYSLIAGVIRKQVHRERYRMRADNPYDLALTFAMERLVPLLEERGQQHCRIVAEARGKNEDAELQLSFLHIVNYGTFYTDADRMRSIQFELNFLPKSMNIVGTQLADLAAYPIARYVSDKDKPNPAYDIVRHKFYRGKGLIRGLKIFP